MPRSERTQDCPECGTPTEPERWIPIEVVIGRASLPESAARVVKAAVDRMLRDGDVRDRNKWQALEYLAADWLAGQADEDEHG